MKEGDIRAGTKDEIGGGLRATFPVVVSAPSGGGKTTLCRAVVELDPSCAYSVSATSRPRLAAERDGHDYHFLSREAFEDGIGAGRFVEWTEYRDRYYGTQRKSLEQALDAGRVVLLDLDSVGARTMRKLYPDCVTVYVLAPSMEELEKRLRGRERDSEEEIRGRLRAASDEMKNIREYDYVIVNERFEESVRRLRCIIEAERSRVSRMKTGDVL